MKNGIDSTPTIEELPDIDFLSENLKISLTFEEEAVDHLPTVTPEDLRTRMEKYRVLTGKMDLAGENSIALHIKGILEITDENGFYTEGVEEVKNVNLLRIQKAVKQLQEYDPSYANYGFLGDIHTHPVLPDAPYEGFDPSLPSVADMTDIISNYESGQLSSSAPFIFGIAAPEHNGQTTYSFYRLIQVDGEYKCTSVALN